MGHCNQIVTTSVTRRVVFHPNTTTDAPEKQLGFLKISERQGREDLEEISSLREICNRKLDQQEEKPAKR